jgi:hypothetical protein
MLYSSDQVVIGFYNKIKIIKHGMIEMATSLDHFGHLIDNNYVCIYVWSQQVYFSFVMIIGGFEYSKLTIIKLDYCVKIGKVTKSCKDS